MPFIRACLVVVLGLGAFVAGCGSEKKMDQCTAGLCQNGGTCTVDASGSVMCICPAGFSGPDCGLSDAICDTNPCENGGTCMPASGGYACTCPTGITGSRCQNLPASCDPNPCQNGGTCTLMNGAVQCACTPSFTGPLCATAVEDHCTPNPCANGGTCTSTVDGFTCACTADYVGDKCETFLLPGDLDLSGSNTQGRTCVDGGDMVSYSVVALAPDKATLSAAPSMGCLAAGDEVLLINLQGTSTSIFNVGNWELLTVLKVEGADVTFAVAKQRFYGDTVSDDSNLGVLPSNQRVVLQRVPRYDSIEVGAGRTVTAAAWNGVKGGVFALRVADTATVSGVVTMAGKGYRGGATTVSANQDGQEGESLRGLGTRIALANTGGAGGGPGATTCSAAIGVSGAGGGYGGPGADAGGTGGANCGSKGGVAYGDADLTKIFLGSGGGSGGASADASTSPAGGYDGNGGGIIMVFAGGTVTGLLTAAGQGGYGDAAECTLPSTSTTDCWDESGPGGGGSGGSILVSTTAGFMGTADIDGGAGGDGVNNGPNNGGNGAVGRARTN